MSDIAIKVENLSKLYRLGQIGTGTISHDLNRWWHRIRGLEDPYSKAGEVNDRTQSGQGDYVWSLKNIDFEVKKGEVLGIIGNNGAGKSTLLKILSQITSPTKGSVKTKGRIASLLEVGTGFHPDLTGLENIYLNGSILGMRKVEITRKLDEIIEFSGVAKYIDTPVKRYSSGMMVRLGFAVAAHLEPEILVVDEVLAVGDAEFQRKCTGKMQDVSRAGRTILFVSHNMTAVKSLCKTGIYLKNGSIVTTGKISEVVGTYLSSNRQIAETGIIPENFEGDKGDRSTRIKLVRLENTKSEPVKELFFGESFSVKIEFESFDKLNECTACILIGTTEGDNFIIARDPNYNVQSTRTFEKGMNSITVTFNSRIMPGRYSLSFGLFLAKSGATVQWVEHVYEFSVSQTGVADGDDYPYYTRLAYVEPVTKWSYN
jgi:lipopolysaccharide transport system ATP-binding protein